MSNSYACFISISHKDPADMTNSPVPLLLQYPQIVVPIAIRVRDVESPLTILADIEKQFEALHVTPIVNYN